MPSSKPKSLSYSSLLAESMIIGISLIFFISLQAENPSSFGHHDIHDDQIIIIELAKSESGHAVGGFGYLMPVEFRSTLL